MAAVSILDGEVDLCVGIFWRTFNFVVVKFDLAVSWRDDSPPSRLLIDSIAL